MYVSVCVFLSKIFLCWFLIFLQGRGLFQQRRWIPAKSFPRQLERKEWIICFRLYKERITGLLYWCKKNCGGHCTSMDFQAKTSTFWSLDTISCILKTKNRRMEAACINPIIHLFSRFPLYHARKIETKCWCILLSIQITMNVSFI